MLGQPVPICAFLLALCETFSQVFNLYKVVCETFEILPVPKESFPANCISIFSFKLLNKLLWKCFKSILKFSIELIEE